jgi:hypothetical protein
VPREWVRALRRLLTALGTRLRLYRREILHQHAVDEDVASAHLPQEDAGGGVVQECIMYHGVMIAYCCRHLAASLARRNTPSAYGE